MGSWGAGFYIWEGYSDFGAVGSLGKRFGLGSNLTLPVKLRAALVNDEAAPAVMFSLSAGLEFGLSARRSTSAFNGSR